MQEYDEFMDTELYRTWKEGFMRGVFVATFVTACICIFVGMIECTPR